MQILRTRENGSPTRALARLGIGLALALVGATPLRAIADDRQDVQIAMSVDGSKGPFAAQGYGNGFVKVTNVVVDAGAGAGTDPKTAPKPVLVTKPIDRTSSEFHSALASGETLNVVITLVQPSTEEGVPMRRIVTLSNARIASIHGSMDVKGGPPQALGVETISLTYEKLDIVDDGVRVFSAGG